MSQQRTIDILQSIRQGAFLDELGRAIEDAVTAQQEHGRAATVNVSIKLDGVKDAHDKALVSVSASITKKLPGRDAFKQLLYATGANTLLSTRDPRQPDMFAPKVVAPDAAAPTETDPAQRGETG